MELNAVFATLCGGKEEAALLTKLPSGVFLDKDAKALKKAIATAVRRNLNADLATIGDVLKETLEPAQAEGLKLIAEAGAAAEITAVKLPGYIQRLEKLWRQRRMIQLGTSLTKAGYENGDPEDWADQLDSSARELRGTVTGDNGDGRRLVLRGLDEVKLEPLRWLVPDFIPLGKLTLVASPGGEGKSSILNSIMAAGSRGHAAMGLIYDPPPPYTTLLLSLEEDEADTLGPRLWAMGADRSRIKLIDGVEDRNKGKGKGDSRFIQPFTLDYAEDLVAEIRANPSVKLVVIDPVTGVLGRRKQNDQGDVREGLQRILQVAIETGVAVVAVTHTNKSTDTAKAIDRVLGSVAFVNVPRAVFMVMRNATDNDQRLLLSIKGNLAKGRPARAFRMVKPDPAVVAEMEQSADLSHLNADDRKSLFNQVYTVQWEDAPADVDADELLRQSRSRGDAPSERKNIKAWLEVLFCEFAWPSEEIDAAARALDFSLRTMNVARKELKDAGKISCKPKGQGKDKVFWWGPGTNSRLWIKRPESESIFEYAGKENNAANADNAEERPGATLRSLRPSHDLRSDGSLQQPSEWQTQEDADQGDAVF